MNIEIRQKTGRCANGAQRDGGSVWHAIPAEDTQCNQFGAAGTDAVAVCGARPGRTSPGWSHATGDAVTCVRCKIRLGR